MHANICMACVIATLMHARVYMFVLCVCLALLAMQFESTPDRVDWDRTYQPDACAVFTYSSSLHCIYMVHDDAIYTISFAIYLVCYVYLGTYTLHYVCTRPGCVVLQIRQQHFVSAAFISPCLAEAENDLFYGGQQAKACNARWCMHSRNVLFHFLLTGQLLHQTPPRFFYIYKTHQGLASMHALHLHVYIYKYIYMLIHIYKTHQAGPSQLQQRL